MIYKEILTHTKELLRIPSVAGDLLALRQAVDYIAALLATRQDITIERFESNGIPSLLAYHGTGQRPMRFNTLLNGHVDVVPGNSEQFVPKLQNGRLYGRGVYDMKMACIIMTDIFLNHVHDPSRPIALQIVADEEIGGYNGVRHQIDNGVAADFAIFGEMTDMGICNETRGICWTELRFKGVRAHGGYLWEGENAVTKASDFANALLKRFPLPNERQWCSTANIASITTGNPAYNIVPDEATLRVDFRFTPEDETFKTRANLEHMLKSIDPDVEIIDVPVLEPAVSVSREDPYLKHLLRTYEDVVGTTPALIRRYASGDGRHFAYRGMPCVEFGLTGANLHGNDEYVNLESIEVYRATLAAFLSGDVPLNTPALAPTQLRTTD